MNEILKNILDNEELQYYLNMFKSTPTVEKIKSLPKEFIQKEYELIKLKQSKLSRRERDIIVNLYERRS